MVVQVIGGQAPQKPLNLETDLYTMKESEPGACFHGEVWVRCPYCGKAMQLVGVEPVATIKNYRIFRCSCGELFKDKI